MTTPDHPSDDLLDLLDEVANGCIPPERFALLARRLADDAAARRAYICYMDLHAELMARAAPAGVPVPETLLAQPRPQRPDVAPHRLLRLAAWAAVALLAVAGWAWGVSSLLDRWVARQELAAAQEAIAQIRQRAKTPVPAETPGGEPEVISTRGLVLALAPQAKESTQVTAGRHAPLDRRLWTCPWGAADLRYSDGTSIEMERSTVIVLSEEGGSRRVNLESGVLFVKNYPPEGETREVLVHTPHADVHVPAGEAAVAAEARRTLVELAVGSAQVALSSGEAPETCTVEAGQYLVVQPGGRLKAVKGRLKWRLVP